jgi:2-polyprenyl-3-methyl-5-hydroxy-6-metoxy-1,4-benzoquinol methylase
LCDAAYRDHTVLIGTSADAQHARPFAGAAQVYAAYRIPYPQQMIDDLAAATAADGIMLDLACGTGELALPLSPHFRQVIAVDAEPDMIDVGRAKASAQHIANVTWQVQTAESLQLPPACLDLLTIGNAWPPTSSVSPAGPCSKH